MIFRRSCTLLPLLTTRGPWESADSIGPKLLSERAGPVHTAARPLQTLTAMYFSVLLRVTLLTAALLAAPCAIAQPSGPPAVGVVTAERQPMTESYEFNGRIQPINTVNIVARVTAFLEKQLFVEGGEVKSGDLLYRLEKMSFQAAVDVQAAAVEQAEAKLANDNSELRRAQRLLQTNAGSAQAADRAEMTQRVAAAQLKSAQAQLKTAHINLSYTDIRAPIDGLIDRTSVTTGNVVSPTSGIMATLVSQDPMYVVFSVSTRQAIELRQQYADKGFDAFKFRLRLPDGRLYGEVGKPDFFNNTIARDSDTLLVRGVVPNPPLGSQTAGRVRLRELIADESVTVLLESVMPRQVIPVPRAALLANQEGTYVYVIDEHNVARQRDVRIGPSTSETAGIIDGLAEGERIIIDGIERVRTNSSVSPAPASSLTSGSKHR
jgi:membrane fusion protein, multidrug efflux system